MRPPLESLENVYFHILDAGSKLNGFQGDYERTHVVEITGRKDSKVSREIVWKSAEAWVNAGLSTATLTVPGTPIITPRKCTQEITYETAKTRGRVTYSVEGPESADMIIFRLQVEEHRRR
jgi:hypothetical protein